MPQKILVTRNPGSKAMDTLKASGFELIVNPEDAEPSRAWVLEHLKDPELVSACIMHGQKSDKVDKEFIDACGPNVKCISTFSVGFDHIDVPLANSRGIKIGHTPGVLSDAVADIAVALTLMAMRRIGEGIDIVKGGKWPQIPWAPFVMCGPSLGHPDLTIGFLGFGRISEVTLDRLVAFTNKAHPPTVLYTSSRARPDQAERDAEFTKRWEGKVASVSRVKDPLELARKSDVVVVLCSLNEKTKDLVNKEFLKAMKRTAVLVNAARGPIVNSDDLADALDNGELFAAGLDVITDEPNIGPEHRLVKSEKCVVIPHMGSADYDTREAMADLCVRNAIAGAKGEVLPAEVKV